MKKFTDLELRILRLLDDLPLEWEDGKLKTRSINEVQALIQEKFADDPDFKTKVERYLERDVAFWHGVGVEVLYKVEGEKQGFIQWIQEENRLNKYIEGPAERDELVKQFNGEK